MRRHKRRRSAHPRPHEAAFDASPAVALSRYDTKQDEPAGFERSDVTAVPAAGVVGEAMVALVLGSAMREKFGGDSIGEMRRNFEGYREQLRGY